MTLCFKCTGETLLVVRRMLPRLSDAQYHVEWLSRGGIRRRVLFMNKDVRNKLADVVRTAFMVSDMGFKVHGVVA